MITGFASAQGKLRSDTTIDLFVNDGRSQS